MNMNILLKFTTKDSSETIISSINPPMVLVTKSKEDKSMPTMTFYRLISQMMLFLEHKVLNSEETTLPHSF